MFTILPTISIQQLMHDSNVTFGTSGARGLVTNMTDVVCYAYTKAFLQYLGQIQCHSSPNKIVGIAGDLRPSSPRIMNACAEAALDMGLVPVNCGFIPTPAVTAWGLANNAPTLMVTGSHIPDDRNGIKFNDLYGEILKDDEVAIRNQVVTLPLEKFDANQNLIQTNNDFLTSIDTSASLVYQRRYTEFFAPNCLSNLRIGLYQHSSVSRDILYNILTQLGARVTPLERSEHFIPVDTEAVRQLDQDLAYKWAATGQFDCIVSTDGDGDRPLFADETGTWWRGDIVGILTARYLGIRTIVTPISSNTAVESSNWFSTVTRTRIGSPYVIVNMQKAVTTGLSPVAGYEANGGFLLASSIIYKDKILTALPTRDATIVILSILLLARETACTASQLLTTLPARYTASGRLQNFSAEVSKQRIDALVTNSMLLNTEFTKYFGNVKEINIIDGLRMTFDNGEILHLRPSGNAPELRAYAEAATPTRANAMVQNAMELLKQWRN